MSLQRCITPPEGMRVIVVREEYLAITGGDHCAAALLSAFEHELNLLKARDIDVAAVWLKRSKTALSENLMGLFSARTIAKALEKLVKELKFLERRESNNAWDQSHSYRLRVAAVQKAVDDHQAKLPDASSKIAQSSAQNYPIDDAELPDALSKIARDSDSRSDHSLEDESEKIDPAAPDWKLIWECAKAQMEIQLDSHTFDAWLRDVMLVRVDAPSPSSAAPLPRVVLSARNQQQVDQLLARLARMVRQVVGNFAGQPVEIGAEIGEVAVPPPTPVPKSKVVQLADVGKRGRKRMSWEDAIRIAESKPGVKNPEAYARRVQQNGVYST